MYGIILDEKRTFEAEEIKNEKPQDWNKLGISENIKKPHCLSGVKQMTGRW